MKTCSEYTVRLDSQVSEIQRYQEQEATSRPETVHLREQLKQAQEKVHSLEQDIATRIEAGGKHSSPLKNIVPFSTIETQLSPHRGPSPYNDPADFAMLFMSDECFPATPFHEPEAKMPQGSPKSTIVEKSQPAEENAGSIFDLPAEVDTPKPKRKEVNFEHPESPKKSKQPRKAEAKSILAEKDQDNPPKKVSKHIHKWTYSRVHSTATEIQQEQAVMPVAERRASPKGLVSASSGNDARGRGNGRSRGRRRSRGMKAKSVDGTVL